MEKGRQGGNGHCRQKQQHVKAEAGGTSRQRMDSSLEQRSCSREHAEREGGSGRAHISFICLEESGFCSEDDRKPPTYLLKMLLVRCNLHTIKLAMLSDHFNELAVHTSDQHYNLGHHPQSTAPKAPCCPCSQSASRLF